MEILFILFIFMIIYFLPTILAYRGYQNAFLVFLVNLLVGWTLIGWVIALILAFGTNTKKYEEAKYRREVNLRRNEEEKASVANSKTTGHTSKEIISTVEDNERVKEMKRKAAEYELKKQIKAEIEEEIKAKKLRKLYEAELRKQYEDELRED